MEKQPPPQRASLSRTIDTIWEKNKGGTFCYYPSTFFYLARIDRLSFYLHHENQFIVQSKVDVISHSKTFTIHPNQSYISKKSITGKVEYKRRYNVYNAR